MRPGCGRRPAHPTPGRSGRIDTFFQDALLRWSATDLEEISTLVLGAGAACIDLHAALRARLEEDIFEADGVHLNLRGRCWRPGTSWPN